MASADQRPRVGPGKGILDRATVVVDAGAEGEQPGHGSIPNARYVGTVGTRGADVGQLNDISRVKRRVETAETEAEVVHLTVADLHRVADADKAVALLANERLRQISARAIRLIAFSVIVEAADGQPVLVSAQRAVPGRGVLHIRARDDPGEIALQYPCQP